MLIYCAVSVCLCFQLMLLIHTVFSSLKPTDCFLSFAQNNIINFITVNNYRKELGNVVFLLEVAQFPAVFNFVTTQSSKFGIANEELATHSICVRPNKGSSLSKISTIIQDRKFEIIVFPRL